MFVPPALAQDLDTVRRGGLGGGGAHPNLYPINHDMINVFISFGR